MKLIIEIDEEEYKRAKNGNSRVNAMRKAIANGIPLKDEVMIATLMSLVTDKDYKPNLE